MPLSLSLINVLPNNAPSSGKKNLRKAVYFIRAFNLMYLTVKLIAVKALLLMFSLQATKEYLTQRNKLLSDTYVAFSSPNRAGLIDRTPFLTQICPIWELI